MKDRHYEHATARWATRNRAISHTGGSDKAARTIISHWRSCIGSSGYSSWTNTRFDIQVTVDPANLTGQIAQLKQKMNINIEFASPGDFMPLPTQWEARSQFIKRYDQVDVFYFDWYSIALSKMQRVNRQDVIDVQLLIQKGFVDITELDFLYQDVLNKVGKPPYDRLFPNLSPQQFAQHYQAARQLL